MVLSELGLGLTVPMASPADGPLLAGALLLAWGLDQCLGEPPDRWHPVAWLGHVAGPLGRWLKRLPPSQALWGGALAWTTGALLLVLAGAWLQQLLLLLPAWLAVPLLAVLIKPLFAWRMLYREVQAVGTSLGPDDQGLDAARQQLARLVSRPTATLDAPTLRESAIETLAENLNDSLVAPLFWLLLAGLPGMLVYRMANTLDAMWGYRGDWEWAGKWAARADDLLSWLPARLSACLLMPWPGRDGLALWRRLPGEAALTPSPNGGWCMGAMALQLGVRLHKPGVYVLNAGAATPGPEAMGRALQRGQRAASLAMVGSVLCLAAPGLLQWLA